MPYAPPTTYTPSPNAVARFARAGLLFALAITLMGCPSDDADNSDIENTTREPTPIHQEIERAWSSRAWRLPPNELPPPLEAAPPNFGEHLGAVLENVLETARLGEPRPPFALVERAHALAVNVSEHETLWEVSADPFIGAGMFLIHPDRVRSSRDVMSVPHAFSDGDTLAVAAALFEAAPRFSVIAINTIDRHVVDVSLRKDSLHQAGLAAVCRYLMPALTLELDTFRPDEIESLSTAHAVASPGSAELAQPAEVDALRKLFSAHRILRFGADTDLLGGERRVLGQRINAALAEGAPLGAAWLGLTLSKWFVNLLLDDDELMADLVRAFDNPHAVIDTPE